MKANKNQIERALDAPSADIRIFVLHGPDEAGSAALAKRIERAMGEGAERIDLDGPGLKGDPARLADEAAAFSMFGDKRWIRISQAGDEIAPAVEALLEAPQAGNPVVLIAGNLKTTGAVLKLCLASPAAMAFASYAPEGRDADQVAVAMARELGLRLAPDAARQLSDVTGGDRGQMGGELEKIALYLDAAPDRPADAGLEELDVLLAGPVEDNLGALVNAVLSGDLPRMTSELQRARSLGASLMGMTRLLSARAVLLAGIRAHVERGGSVDAAVESAGKAVFWKDKGAVARQTRIWTSEHIARLLHRLNEAERASRSPLGELQIEHEMLNIARQAARAR